jgi:hypothetical protein
MKNLLIAIVPHQAAFEVPVTDDAIAVSRYNLPTRGVI